MMSPPGRRATKTTLPCRAGDDDTITLPCQTREYVRDCDHIAARDVNDPAMALFIGLLFVILLVCAAGSRGDATQQPLGQPRNSSLIPQGLFRELEQLARLVDIAYCVGTAGLGIQKPFKCASRCADRDFEGFELVTVCHSTTCTAKGPTDKYRHGTRDPFCLTPAATLPLITHLPTRASSSPSAAPTRSQTPSPTSRPYRRSTCHTPAATTTLMHHGMAKTRRRRNPRNAKTALCTWASTRRGSMRATSSCHT
jgi:hypothetical protein